MDCDEIHMNTQSLRIGGQLRTLNQITAMTSNEMSRNDARIVHREDHFHDIGIDDIDGSSQP